MGNNKLAEADTKKSEFEKGGYVMSKSNRKGIWPMYASGYKVTITESNTVEDTEDSGQEMIYQEIDENEKDRNNQQYISSALDDRIPADFITDNNRETKG